MTGNWYLIRPGRRYRRPPAPDDPVARELRAMAARDRAADRGHADWPEEERERWLPEWRAVSAYYDPARRPERIQAPLRWRDELVSIAVVVTLHGVVERRLPNAWWVAIVMHPAWESTRRLERELRRRSARRLGLTPETVPPLSTIYGGWFYFAGLLATLVWSSARGEPVPRPSWPVYLAARIILAVNERQSWRAATRQLS